MRDLMQLENDLFYYCRPSGKIARAIFEIVALAGLTMPEELRAIADTASAAREGGKYNLDELDVTLYKAMGAMLNSYADGLDKEEA